MTILSKVIDNDRMQKITAEFSRLGDRCYLENSGAALYPQSLLQQVNEDLMKNVYMNPHTDKYTKDCIEQMRYLVLKYFNTDPANYTVIFTSGTTQSLKLVVESFTFAPDNQDMFNCGSFVYLQDNHTSVLGLREIALDRNADVIHISHDDFLNAMDPRQSVSSETWKDEYKNEGNTLFVYPALSNFNGFKYPINRIQDIKNGCLNNHIKKYLCNVNSNWYVLLDAASYIATNRLDLSKAQADFVCLSFYKVFGYPTGLGALLVKNSSQHLLKNKLYFGGGTVDIVLSDEYFHVKRDNLYERFEDGTNAFLSIIALKHCFDTLERLIPRMMNGNVMDTISHHTYYLAQDLYKQLKHLKHPNGSYAAVLYMDSDFTDITYQGSIVTFNLTREDKTYIGYSEVSLMYIMDTISHHTYYLAQDLYKQLKHLKHPNGSYAAVLYMDSDFTDITYQGSIVTFNLTREDKTYIGYSEFQQMADLFHINVRTGCFCNSGSCQRHLNATNGDMKEMYKAGHKCGDEIDLIYGKPTGAVRASFGYYNTFNDVDRLMQMICQCFVKTKYKIPKRYMDFNRYKEVPKPIQNELEDIKKIEKKSMKVIQNVPTKTIKNKQNDRIILEEIAIFPIKSCGAFKITSAWKIGLRGFEYDREWMIVKDNGVCLTQKQNPRMCMIRPKIDLIKKLLILNFKGKSPISIPLNPKISKNTDYISLCHSKVCMDTIQGVDCGDEVANWISEALEVSFLRLIRQSRDDNRTQKKKGIPESEKRLLSLSNQAQFLLINKATVRWLRDKIEDQSFIDNIDELTDRFRGNIVVDANQELVERDWEHVIIGKHEFRIEGQCPRCQMVCIDQQTGQKTVEPLRTIAEQFAGKLRFGIYLSYIGPVDGSNDKTLMTDAQVRALTNGDNVSRFIPGPRSVVITDVHI